MVFFVATKAPNQVPASRVEKLAISAEPAPVQEVNRQTQQVGSDVTNSPATECCSTDIKDEYSFGDNVYFDEHRFTNDYYIYEQGQKDIIVKNRLKQHIQFWRDIGANQFILDSIEFGYKIPFYSLPESEILKNNKSARENATFIVQAISDLLDKGLIEKLDIPPKVVNPLSVSVQSSGKKRLILDLRWVNKHVWKQSVKYEDLRLALMYLQRGGFMIKFDIHSAYHFVDIFPEHRTYLGFSFPDKCGVVCYYKFKVLAFGLGVAPYFYTKLTRPLIAKWRGEGKKVIMFLDDGFGTDDSYEQTVQLASDVKRDLLNSGLIPKSDKCIWDPVQEMEWLGVCLNTSEFSVSIPERRISKAFHTLKFLNSFYYVPVRKVASFIGQIISMSIVIGPVAQIMTRYLNMDVVCARSWNSYIKLSNESKNQLEFWKETIQSLNIRFLSDVGACSRVVYSDASNVAYAGYEVGTVNGIAHGSWSPDEKNKSSTWRELCGVYRVLKSLIHVLSSQRVKWFTDNKGVSSIVAKGSMKSDLQYLAMKIFNFAAQYSIHLEVEWVPREKNIRADYFSKIVEKDDWGIGWDIFEMIKLKWDMIEVDVFASEHNAKLETFFSRFWCPGCAGIDAFTFDWAEFFGLYVPPIILIPRILKKMAYCKAEGVLIVPEWRSASFWPLICEHDGKFCTFVKDMIVLPSEKEYYVPCKNSVGIFGTEDLKFRMIALKIEF